MATEIDGRVTGYLYLTEYPEASPQDYPTKADCKGYKFMSMVQLCNIADAHGQSCSSVCNAFGGDKGDIPVQPDRQAWKWNGSGHKRVKFVQVSAVEDYFKIIGIDW